MIIENSFKITGTLQEKPLLDKVVQVQALIMLLLFRARKSCTHTIFEEPL